MLVIHYVRQTPDHWTITRYRAAPDTLTIATLEVTLALSDIYRKVAFCIVPLKDALQLS
jgi:hypothetical protein